MGRAKTVSNFVKRYDPKLYAEYRDGKLCVLRKAQRIESYEVDGTKIGFVRPAPFIVFALTDDWTINGTPRDWGLMPIYQRLGRIDLWNGRDIAKEQIEQEERRLKSIDRAVDNHMESYLKDIRREYARTTNDILTHSLKKD